MAPRGRKRKSGLMREDAARDRMRDYGFQERVIKESIKELLELYGEDQWFLIEDDSYAPLLAICLEKQEEINKQLAEVQTNQLAENQNDEMAEALAEEEQPNQLAMEEQANQLPEEEEEKEQEQDMHVEDGRDQADDLSITSEAVMDPSPAAFLLGEALADYAPHSVEGVKNRHCGWLSSEEETDPKEDSDSDGDDDEMIQLTPEPLCEELEELLREVRGQTKRKKETRWDK